MDRDDNRKMDEGLQGNEKIEQAIRELQQAPSGEELAHTLTVVRRRMKEGGQFIVAVEPPRGDGKIQIQAIQTADGQQWWAAFTSFEEELKGSGSVMSTFLCIGDRRDKRCYRKSLEPHIDDGQESDPDCVGKSTFLTVRPGI